jgi:hypothetical protein
VSLGDIEPGDGVVRHLVALPNHDADANLMSFLANFTFKVRRHSGTQSGGAGKKCAKRM